MNQKGTRDKAALIRAKTVHDQATPREPSMLLIAKGSTAPQMLQVVAPAARADAA
jgi:hypothetical protein